ncbi:hypothetical protein PFISCL1PPCAC_18833, partial [Pristionchus fissidentatus]
NSSVFLCYCFTYTVTCDSCIWYLLFQVHFPNRLVHYSQIAVAHRFLFEGRKTVKERRNEFADVHCEKLKKEGGEDYRGTRSCCPSRPSFSRFSVKKERRNRF